MLNAQQLQAWKQDGYVVISQLFSADEVARYRAHYMAMRGQGALPGDLAGVDAKSDDPLIKYPRMIHMHRFDETSMKFMIDARIRQCLAELTGVGDPFAVQTMLYFKPAGARGQALHQDNAYLRAQPSTCVAAWLALDDCDEENGCMRVIPGSHEWPLLCAVKADTSQSFTDVTVPIPDDKPARPIYMKAGDMMFFNGQLVHGSLPNMSKDRFRRALIGHYIQGDAQAVYKWYQPSYRMDGTVMEFGDSPDGSQCGVWTEIDGRRTIELTDMLVGASKSD